MGRKRGKVNLWLDAHQEDLRGMVLSITPQYGVSKSIPAVVGILNRDWNPPQTIGVQQFENWWKRGGKPSRSRDRRKDKRPAYVDPKAFKLSKADSSYYLAKLIKGIKGRSMGIL